MAFPPSVHNTQKKLPPKYRKQSIPCDENELLDFIKNNIWNQGNPWNLRRHQALKDLVSISTNLSTVTNFGG